MHYYKRNLGDYAKKAGRLSMLQHGSYTLLIDACYDREQFPTLEEAIEWTWASTAEEIDAVSFVLGRFFTLENGVYVQNRIREEIEAYQKQSSTNKRIANERETKRAENSTERTRSVDEALEKTHASPPNQEPITNNQEPITKYIISGPGQPEPPMPCKTVRKVSGRRTALTGEWVIEDGCPRDLYAKQVGMTEADIDIQCDKFENFHKGKGNLMADWDSAWRTWCRNWQDYKQARRS